MIPKMPAPDLIRGGYRFSGKIMLNQETAEGWVAIGAPRMPKRVPDCNNGAKDAFAAAQFTTGGPAGT
jgi:hypothetical protein